MKNRMRIPGIVMAALLLGTTVEFAVAQDAQRGMGPGMMGGKGYGHCTEHGMGMMGGQGYGHCSEHGMMGFDYQGLNLSADQKSKVTKIRKDMRTKQFALMEKMMDAQDKLQELYDVDQQDASAIKKQYQVIEDLRMQMVDNSVDAHNKINSLLTKEQREKFREYRHGYGGPMMHGH